MTASDLDVAAIQARVDAATEGPWRVDGPFWVDPPGVLHPDESTVEERDGVTGAGRALIMRGDWETRDADAEFIAHARQDVPALLAALRDAREEADYRKAAVDVLRAKHEGGDGAFWADWHRDHCAAARAAADAQAEAERLHTWQGLLELLDEHWPDDIFPTRPDDEKRDTGPRLVSALRRADAAEAALDRVRELADTWKRRARDMGFVAGESPRPVDYSEGHYSGVMRTYRDLADGLLRAIDGPQDEDGAL